MKILNQLTIIAATLTLAYTTGTTEASNKSEITFNSTAYQKTKERTTKAKKQNFHKPIDLFQQELSQNALKAVLNSSKKQEEDVTKKIYEFFKHDTTNLNKQQPKLEPSLTDVLILAYQLNVTPKHLKQEYAATEYGYAGAVYRTIIYHIIHDHKIKLDTFALKKGTPVLNCTTSKIDTIIGKYKNNQATKGDQSNISNLRRLLNRILTPNKYYPNAYPTESCGEPTINIQQITNEIIKPFKAQEGNAKATKQEIVDGATTLKALSILKQILQNQNDIDNEEQQQIASIELIYKILAQHLKQELTQPNNEPEPIISKCHIKELEEYIEQHEHTPNLVEIIQNKIKQIIKNIQDNDKELMQTLILARKIYADDPLYSQTYPKLASQFKKEIEEKIKGWQAPQTLASYCQEPEMQPLKGIIQYYAPSPNNQSKLNQLISLLLYPNAYKTCYMFIGNLKELHKAIDTFQPRPTTAIATPKQIADCQYLIKLMQNIHDKIYAISPKTYHAQGQTKAIQLLIQYKIQEQQQQKQALQAIIQKLQQQIEEAQKEMQIKEKQWYHNKPTQKASSTAHLEQKPAKQPGNKKNGDIDLNEIEKLIEDWIQKKEQINKDKEEKLQQLAQDIDSLEKKYKQLAEEK